MEATEHISTLTACRWHKHNPGSYTSHNATSEHLSLDPLSLMNGEAFQALLTSL